MICAKEHNKPRIKYLKYSRRFIDINLDVPFFKSPIYINYEGPQCTLNILIFEFEVYYCAEHERKFELQIRNMGIYALMYVDLMASWFQILNLFSAIIGN